MSIRQPHKTFNVFFQESTIENTFFPLSELKVEVLILKSSMLNLNFYKLFIRIIKHCMKKIQSIFADNLNEILLLLYGLFS